ncbi:hypothetical protein [Hoeflea alexandrii]|uniref:hypothetical protein n=1 Tax=Hoeflea alexandrii TaxID=288436 RepID=UPI0022AEDD7A|nr:hypothetical protein [Hoeflea alexandrii]MCZ4289238.1 hypothetical protein [Hoeflea alexandrii]
MEPSIAPRTADQKGFRGSPGNHCFTLFSQLREILFATSELRHDATVSMQLGARDEHRSATDGACHLKNVVNTKRKDIAMLYVFNSANRVQIAWNSVLPAPKANEKPRSGALNNLIRTLSAG